MFCDQENDTFITTSFTYVSIFKKDSVVKKENPLKWAV